MKAYLMHPDRDFNLEQPLPANAEALIQDLELDTLLDAMARGDEYLREVATKSLLLGLTDPEAILFRQRILRDCLEHPAIVRQLYDLAVEALESKKNAKVLWVLGLRDSPDSLLHKSERMLELLADVLKRVRTVADGHAVRFRSDGFARLFTTLVRELDDDYLQTVEDHLRELQFRRGALISAELGRGNRGTHYVLRKPHEQTLLQKLTSARPTSYSFTVADRDQQGLIALSELRGKGINLVASALAQSTDHILSFFSMLRAELGFYVACLNLHEQLVEKAEPTCFPVPLAAGKTTLSAQQLYDVSLAFHLDSRVVGNTVNADGKALVLITGANQGGKSTFLRSVGLAQLMMQAGMFVGAESFSASVCDGVFTHFKREEDATMTLGKLEEELSRMREIADMIRPTSLLLCNESFAATNEREGSEIARQVVRPLIEAGVKVFFVTHLFDLAHGFYREQLESALFLRAERQPDGRRTFRLLEGEPLPTSYGADSYRRIFGASEMPTAVAAQND
jgi:DNA mismatch repair ATPase MutS